MRRPTKTFLAVMIGAALTVAFTEMAFAGGAGRGTAMLACIGSIYIMPTAIAVSLRHRRIDAIGALNLLVGWTLVGWIAALVWALRKPR